MDARTSPGTTTERRLVQLVQPTRGAAVERGFLRDRAAGGDALKGIPQHRVAGAHLIDREIALEIAALGAEELDTGFDIGPPGCRPGLGVWRCGQRAKIERRAAIEHAADLN